jgi:hypothetical protein
MNARMIDAVDRYIDYNPLKYELRYGNKAALKLHEPLESFRLTGGEFWRGIGAVELLNEDREMIALRVSRRTSHARIAEAVRRIKARAGEFTIVGCARPFDGTLRSVAFVNARIAVHCGSQMRL